MATGSHQAAAGVALIAAAILLGLLVVVIARRQRAEAGSPDDLRAARSGALLAGCPPLIGCQAVGGGDLRPERPAT